MSAQLRWGLIDSPTFTGFPLNTVNTRIALRLLYAKSAIPQSVAVYVNNVTGTAPTYRLRIETSSGGNPSGTLYDANATGTFQPTAAGWYTVAFGTAPAALAANTVYHLVVEYAAGACDVSNNAGILYQSAGPFGNIRAFTVQTSTALPTWTEPSSTSAGIFAITFAGGVALCNTCRQVNSAQVWGATRAGMRFELTFAAVVAGFGAHVSKTGNPGDLYLALLDTGGAVVASLQVPAALVGTSGVKNEFTLNQSVNLAASKTYRLVARTALGNEASSADRYNLTTMEFKDAASSFAGGSAQSTTAAADAGPWTDTATQDALLWLVLDGINASTGLNTVGDVLQEGDWQADAWSPRMADDTEFQNWVARLIGRANNYVKWRVGNNYYTAQAGSIAEQIFREAEMQYCQHLLCMSAATVADTSDHDDSAPWLADGRRLRETAEQHRERVEELLGPYDTVRGRPGRTGPYFKGVTTAEQVVARFDPDKGAENGS